MDMKATLYLGADIQHLHTVTDTDFSLFLEDHVTPRFPGFTVHTGTGYWKGKPETVRELVIIGDGSQDFGHAVEAIGQNYKVRFQQEAVMVTYEPLLVRWDVPGFAPEPLGEVG